MSVLGSSPQVKPKRSSSFLARLRGSMGMEKGEEQTGLRSLMHSMSKDAKRASSHALFVDEDESTIWEGVEKSNQSDVEIHLTMQEVIVLALPERFQRFKVPLHSISSLKASSSEITFYWNCEGRRESRTFKMEHPKKLYQRFFEIVAIRLQEEGKKM
eukprot:Phypoly_transcript_19769.p1 GENE.Phypoly_transcript_19769~~Phypoly_transcript_19769.p1  ORF type:complete len:158 (+),score=16.14 Phypoly_transcript_19769:234-707(+)